MTALLTWREFPASGIAALFFEADGEGDIRDIDALRNRPAKDPANWLSHIKYHSQLDNLEVASDDSVLISHLATTGATSGGASGGGGVGGSGGGKTNKSIKYGASSATFLLKTHSQGVLADCIVVVGDNVLFPGMPVQLSSDGRGRYCSAYVSTTEVRLFEWTSVSPTALAAISLTYRVFVFHPPRAASGDVLFKFDPTANATEMGLGKFNTGRKYAQIVDGGSPFGLVAGKQVSVKNGSYRTVTSDGSVFEPIPSDFVGNLGASYGDGTRTYTGAAGDSMAYTGSFAGGPRILVQMP